MQKVEKDSYQNFIEFLKNLVELKRNNIFHECRDKKIIIANRTKNCFILSENFRYIALIKSYVFAGFGYIQDVV